MWQKSEVLKEFTKAPSDADVDRNVAAEGTDDVSLDDKRVGTFFTMMSTPLQCHFLIFQLESASFDVTPLRNAESHAGATQVPPDGTKQGGPW